MSTKGLPDIIAGQAYHLKEFPMITMKALKRVRYPSGADGKEYAVGDPFPVLSERDAKALSLVGKAERVGSTNPTDPPAKTVLRAVEPVEIAKEDGEEAPKRRYRRRDMSAENGQTGDKAT